MNTMLKDFDIRLFIMRALSVIIAMVMHEWAHAYSAYRLGDDTAKEGGRLSFNPFRHVDFLGILMLMLLGFGWAKPVQINQSKLRHGKIGIITVAMAGILMNLLLFFIANSLLVMNLKNIFKSEALAEFGLRKFADFFTGYGYSPMQVKSMDIKILYHQFLISFSMINMGLAFFNLLPIPPLDGSHVLDQVVFGGKLYTRIDRRVIGVFMLAIFLLARYTDFLGRYMLFWMRHAQDLALRIIGL